MITVRELIEMLQKHDPEALICKEARGEFFQVSEESVMAGFASLTHTMSNPEDKWIDDFEEDEAVLKRMGIVDIRKAVCL